MSIAIPQFFELQALGFPHKFGYSDIPTFKIKFLPLTFHAIFIVNFGCNLDHRRIGGDGCGL
jgi:hypothetical protein